VRTRDQRGVVFPSPVVILSVVAVAMAAFAFVATRGAEPTEREITPAARDASPSAEASASSEPSEEPSATPEPEKTQAPVERAEVLVEVYNNSSVTGLASRVGDSAGDAGWQVVGTDNWYGTIPATTVYFPKKMKREADLLALDLGIDRVMPSVEPMRGDRLTLILTGEL